MAVVASVVTAAVVAVVTSVAVVVASSLVVFVSPSTTSVDGAGSGVAEQTEEWVKTNPATTANWVPALNPPPTISNSCCVLPTSCSTLLIYPSPL